MTLAAIARRLQQHERELRELPSWADAAAVAAAAGLRVEDVIRFAEFAGPSFYKVARRNCRVKKHAPRVSARRAA